MEKKHVILLTVVAVATLLTAVVGATFAYFSTTVTKNIANGNNTATVSTAKYSASTITFTSGSNKIELENAVPGDTSTTDFTITNSGETAIDYNITWTDVTSTFNVANPDFVGTVPATQADELVYTVACTGGTTFNKTETTMPLNNSDDNAKIATGVTVSAGATASCSLVVTFKNTGADQNYNQGRAFTGTVDISTENISK